MLGMFAGMCGAFVGTPAEVALVRMTADGRLPAEERRNYKSVVDALTRITKQEGVINLWRGAIPTMGRSMVVNGAQLASYSQAKEFLLKTGLCDWCRRCSIIGGETQQARCKCVIDFFFCFVGFRLLSRQYNVPFH